MLVESLLDTPAPQRRSRRAATLISFLAQSAGVLMLVALPLIFTEALPHLAGVIEIPTPPFNGPPPEARPHQPSERATPSQAPPTLQQPIRVPHRILMGPDPQSPAPADSAPYIPGAPVGDASHAAPSWIAALLPHHAAPLPAPPPRSVPLVVSEGVVAGWKIRNVEPVYPPLAAAAGIEGEVVMQALIGRDGAIENLQVLSGHPLLISAAVNAVRQWRYQPYYLNGQAVEVDTEIRVRFVLRR